MANYNVTITNGTGGQAMQTGNYSVSVNAAGYTNSSLTPKSYSATAETGQGVFTLAAEGTLTFIVNETGASGGTPVTSGTIIMTDSTGNTTYGSAESIDSNGNAVFKNVPYGNAESPYTIYFRQLTTDDTHNIYSNVISVSMTGATQQVYVTNTPAAQQTITLTDANYTGLPIANAVLTFTATT